MQNGAENLLRVKRENVKSGQILQKIAKETKTEVKGLSGPTWHS